MKYLLKLFWAMFCARGFPKVVSTAIVWDRDAKMSESCREWFEQQSAIHNDTGGGVLYIPYHSSTGSKELVDALVGMTVFSRSRFARLYVVRVTPETLPDFFYEIVRVNLEPGNQGKFRLI